MLSLVTSTEHGRKEIIIPLQEACSLDAGKALTIVNRVAQLTLIGAVGFGEVLG